MRERTQPANRWLVVAIQLALIAGTLVAWEFGVRAGRIDPFFFSAPSQIAATIGGW